MERQPFYDCNIMNNGISETNNGTPFLIHYIIVFVCAAFIMCVCVLKFKYLYWYSQPITFGFTVRRWIRDSTSCGHTSIMNPLSLAYRCNNAVVYPFLHHVRHDIVRVYGGGAAGARYPISDAPYEIIAEFLSRKDTTIVAPSARGALCIPSDTLCIPSDTLEFILSQETHGLSVFIGILTEGDNTPPIKGDNTPSIKGDNTPPIKGVCVLTPRIMISFSPASSSSSSTSIYVCDHLAWAKYITTERESLALLETTEYIQKSREIAGGQTLYRYREIPWFVVPFTTVYTYTFTVSSDATAVAKGIGNGLTIVPVSATNFAIFYAFVNECARDFRCCIFNELTQLQSLIQNGIYRIYMLLFNQVRVMAVYIFAPSWMKVSEGVVSPAISHKRKPKRTIGNRITALHDRISQTSTAVVKYLPPVVRPKYNAFGKRVKRSTTTTTTTTRNGGDDVLLLISSIQHKSLCDRGAFLRGFYAAVATTTASQHNNTVICIDTIAHNYRIIDDVIATTTTTTTTTAPVSAGGRWNLLTRDKWYYILYNAIIHQETPCKDIAII